MKKTIWIVEGRVTDPDAYVGNVSIGDPEWQFSNGPPGEPRSSADYLSLEEGMRAHADALFRFVPQDHVFTIEFTVPHGELQDYWDTNGVMSPDLTLAHILQRDLYDEAGMFGNFKVVS